MEFGLIAPVLILFMMGVIELAMIMSVQNVMESATFTASRLGKTGFKATGKTQEETILASLKGVGSTLLDPTKITVTSLSYKDYDSVGKPEPFTDTNKDGVRNATEAYTDTNGNGKYDTDQGKTGFGNAGDIVVYTMNYPWRPFTLVLGKLVTTNGVLPLSARAVVRNEPYS